MPTLEELRKLAPELADVPDDTAAMMMDMAEDMVSRKQFGSAYDRAVLLLTAHYLTLWSRIGQEGSAAAASLTAGEVTSEREGDLQRSYGSGASGYTSPTEKMLAKTLYGQMFLALRSRHVVSVVTRMG